MVNLGIRPVLHWARVVAEHVLVYRRDELALLPLLVRTDPGPYAARPARLGAPP